jgi:hypothetical protein
METYVDVAGFESAMDGIARETGVEMSAIMRDNSALICADLIKATPPIDVGDGHSGSDASAYRLGKAKVERDIRAIVYGVKSWGRNHKGPSELVGGAHLFKSEDGALYAVEEKNVSQDGMKLAAYHKALRLPSTGNVGNGAKENAASKFAISNFTASRKMHVPEPVLKKYIREMQSHIGTTRAGWMPAFLAFSKNALTSRYNPPAWVRNQPYMGTFTDSGNMEQISGDWTATNQVPWIRRTAIVRLVNYVMDVRARDFWKGNYRMRLDKVLKKREAAS